MNHIPSGEDEISKPASIALNFLEKNINKAIQFKFLDIGCGDGRDIAFLSSNLDNLIMRGIDISFQAITNAIKLNSNKENVSFDCMDWKDLDEAQYDIIYTSGVYHFFNMAERKNFMIKIEKLLKSHGFFFLNTLSSKDTQYFGKGTPVENDQNSFQSEYFLHFSSEEELREDFKFLEIIDLVGYFHKNYANDTEFHAMWLLIGQNAK